MINLNARLHDAGDGRYHPARAHGFRVRRFFRAKVIGNPKIQAIDAIPFQAGKIFPHRMIWIAEAGRQHGFMRGGSLDMDAGALQPSRCHIIIIVRPRTFAEFIAFHMPRRRRAQHDPFAEFIQPNHVFPFRRILESHSGIFQKRLGFAVFGHDDFAHPFGRRCGTVSRNGAGGRGFPNQFAQHRFQRAGGDFGPIFHGIYHLAQSDRIGPGLDDQPQCGGDFFVVAVFAQGADRMGDIFRPGGGRGYVDAWWAR